MKSIIAMSFENCFYYVMNKKNTDYAIISIQDFKSRGFGLDFMVTERCKDVLTLCFDDVLSDEEGYCFTEYEAKYIIEFVKKNLKVSTLVIHCFGGNSRSQAVKHAVSECLGFPPEPHQWMMNPWVYETIKKVWNEKTPE